MNHLAKKTLLLLIVLTYTAPLIAQTVVSGTVKDARTQAALPGVNVVVIGTTQGTVTSNNGQYSLKVKQSPPFTLAFSYTGFRTEKVEVTSTNATLDMIMEEEAMLGQEVVVSANRIEESILKSPVSIEKMDILAIRQSATPDYYDALANMKGVQVTNSSLTHTTVNTRGLQMHPIPVLCN